MQSAVHDLMAFVFWVMHVTDTLTVICDKRSHLPYDAVHYSLPLENGVIASDLFSGNIGNCSNEWNDQFPLFHTPNTPTLQRIPYGTFHNVQPTRVMECAYRIETHITLNKYSYLPPSEITE